MTPPDREQEPTGLFGRLCRAIIGAPKRIEDPQLFHKMALIPVLAWIGLGADGLSSSAYGPEEAYRALGSHTYLALLLGLATAFTVFIISYAYSRIIEHFPQRRRLHGRHSHARGEGRGCRRQRAPGGLRADHHRLHRFLRGCLVQLSSAPFSPSQGAGRLRSLRHPDHPQYQGDQGIDRGHGANFRRLRDYPSAHAAGRRSSPIRTKSPQLAAGFSSGLQHDTATIGVGAIMLLFLRAYSLGGGTYTGIEAVSNSLQIMREPRVQTGKRTMVYMASSLAFTAGAAVSLLCPAGCETGAWKDLELRPGRRPVYRLASGSLIAFVTIFSEGALLLVAAQTGFMGGPRVMSNLAVDSWFPHRFAALSERLTMRNGIMLMGAASIGLLLYTRGSVAALVVMYSINVFITFTLSQLGMSRFFTRVAPPTRNGCDTLPFTWSDWPCAPPFLS